MLRNVLALALVGLASASPVSPAPESDPKARALAQRVLLVLGGEDAWKHTRYLRFDFAVDRGGKTVMRRAHTWDKWTRPLPRRGPDEGRQGAVVVAMNLNTREGAATLGRRSRSRGRRAEAGARRRLRLVGQRHLLAADALQDARPRGQTSSYVGQQSRGDEAWHKLLLTFDGVGLTPKDKYWVFVNKQDRAWWTAGSSC